MANSFTRFCKCGHTLSDHEQKTVRENYVIIKSWRGACEDYDCPCEMFEEVAKVAK